MPLIFEAVVVSEVLFPGSPKISLLRGAGKMTGSSGSDNLTARYQV